MSVLQVNQTTEFQYFSFYLQLNSLPKSVRVRTVDADPFDFSGDVSIAGVNNTRHDQYIHPAVYTAGLNRGYVGCLHNVKIDGK